MANRQLLIRAVVRQAIKANRANPIQPLEAIQGQQFKSVVAEGGRIITGTNDAGGGITFAVPSNFGPDEVMALAEEAIQFIEEQPDPKNIVLSGRRIKKLVVNFSSQNFGN